MTDLAAGTITAIDTADATLHLVGDLLALVDEIDAPDDVLALALTGAGILLLAEVGPVTGGMIGG